MPKNNTSILSTGELAPSLVEPFANQGVTVDVIPFIETRPLDATVLKASLKPYVQEIAFIVFTSSKAVEAVARNIENVPIGWKFFCIGHNTQKTVQKYFGGPAIAAIANTAGELAKEIIKQDITHEIVFFCGDQRRDDLPDELNAAGIMVIEIVTYETKLTPVKTALEYDGILFFSPSAVKSFFSMNDVRPITVLFAIGRTTADALEMHCTNKIIVAGIPSKEEVLNNVLEYFKN